MTTVLPKRQFKVDTRRQNDGRCKRHPKHQQSPGVCSLCLSEKLSQLNNNVSRRTSTTTGSSKDGSSTTSSLSSCYSSSSASSCASPHREKHNKPSSSVLSSFFSRGNNKNIGVLKKSRSMVFIPRSNGRDNSDDIIIRDAMNHRNEKKKRGFWSKLLRHKRSVVDRESNTIFMQRYSRTMRERSSVNDGL